MEVDMEQFGNRHLRAYQYRHRKLERTGRSNLPEQPRVGADHISRALRHRPQARRSSDSREHPAS